MGTELQRSRFSEEDFRGERFKDWKQDVKGNNDLLILTQPDAVRDVHLDYFRAGADIVETNTFSGTSIAQADYGMEEIVYELNREGARLAREAALLAAEGRRPPPLRGRRRRPDEPHAFDLAGREQSGLPRRDASTRCATLTPSRCGG